MGTGGQTDEGETTGFMKYNPENFTVATDPKDGHKATEINLCSFARPHMRSFHFSWFSFFLAFLGWFAFAPLMSVIGPEIKLNALDGWTVNILSVGSTVFMRFLVGPMCDQFGPRVLQSIILLWGGVLTLIGAAVVTDTVSLGIIRFLIGVVGASFVPCQFWNAMLFTKEKAGTAQAIAGGWGNLGGGATQIVMPAIYTAILSVNGGDTSAAWRTSFIVPGAALILCAAAMYFFSDDAPMGNYHELIKAGVMTKKKATESAREGFCDPCTWMLAFQYGACFGVELTVNNMMSGYFQKKFGMDLVTAGAIASSFGLMNLFARALGGILSDKLNGSMGFRGRLWAQFLCLLFEGGMLIIFSRMEIVELAIPMLILFSVGVQMSEGSSFGIVPYIKPSATGAVAGVVGAGGNIGAVCWGMIFRFGGMTASDNLLTIGFIVVAAAMTCPLLFVSGQEGMFCNPRLALASAKSKGQESVAHGGAPTVAVEDEESAVKGIKV